MKQLPGPLRDQPLHFEAEQGHGDGGTGEGASLNDLIDAGLRLAVQELKNHLFVLGEGQGGENAGLVRSRGPVGVWKQVLELGQNVFGTFAQLGALLDQFMASLAARGVDPSWNREGQGTEKQCPRR